MEIGPIHTDADYTAILKEVSRLMESDQAAAAPRRINTNPLTSFTGNCPGACI
jgi:hypothetical protein